MTRSHDWLHQEPGHPVQEGERQERDQMQERGQESEQTQSSQELQQTGTGQNKIKRFSDLTFSVVCSHPACSMWFRT